MKQKMIKEQLKSLVKQLQICLKLDSLVILFWMWKRYGINLLLIMIIIMSIKFNYYFSTILFYISELFSRFFQNSTDFCLLLFNFFGGLNLFILLLSTLIFSL